MSAWLEQFLIRYPELALFLVIVGHHRRPCRCRLNQSVLSFSP